MISNGIRTWKRNKGRIVYVLTNMMATLKYQANKHEICHVTASIHMEYNALSCLNFGRSKCHCMLTDMHSCKVFSHYVSLRNSPGYRFTVSLNIDLGETYMTDNISQTVSPKEVTGRAWQSKNIGNCNSMT